MDPVILKVTLLFICCASFCDAYPSGRQLLPRIPGYVPVYIQHGDTPLEEINVELAEAFHSLPSGRSSNAKDVLAQEDKVEPLPEEAILSEVPQKSEEENIIETDSLKDSEIAANLSSDLADLIDTPEDSVKEKYNIVKSNESIDENSEAEIYSLS